MPRFVLLTHDHPQWHWDFMLEQGNGLRTWRVWESPDSAGPITAEALPVHRLAYLDYEGPVSGGRGMVTRWDAGTYELRQESHSRIELQIDGARLHGTIVLAAARSGEGWECSYAADS